MNLHDKKRLTQLSDEDLMVLYKSGEHFAFEELYRRHGGKVYDYLKKKVAAEVAQDLAQETFTKIHKSRGQYAEQYPFLPWLFTICRNTLFDHFKSLKMSSTVIEANSELTTAVELPNFNIAGALQGLPENQRRAIELRYLQDWTFEKIAKDIKTSPENVRQLISRGLKKVRFGYKESV